MNCWINRVDRNVSGSPWRVGIMPAPKMSVIGDSIRLVPAGSPALFELSALGFSSSEIDVQIISECLLLIHLATIYKLIYHWTYFRDAQHLRRGIFLRELRRSQDDLANFASSLPRPKWAVTLWKWASRDRSYRQDLSSPRCTTVVWSKLLTYLALWLVMPVNSEVSSHFTFLTTRQRVSN